jgi:hypothetical protein
MKQPRDSVRGEIRCVASAYAVKLVRSCAKIDILELAQCPRQQGVKKRQFKASPPIAHVDNFALPFGSRAAYPDHLRGVAGVAAL